MGQAVSSFRALFEQAQEGVAYWAEGAALDYAEGLGAAMLDNDISIDELAKRCGREVSHVRDALAGDWLIDIEDMALMAHHAGARVEIKVLPK